MEVVFIRSVVLLLLLAGHVVFSVVVVRKSDSPDAVNFIVMGDWGGLPFVPYYSPFEKATAQGMSEMASNRSQFLFALGDNFYYDGVVDEFDPRFQNTFEKVFHQDSLKSIDWFLVAGNHDHNGNTTGQIAYSKHSKRWQFPQLWYQVSIQRPTFNITIIMIDTVVLCGNLDDWRNPNQPSGPKNLLMASEQLSYIEAALKNATTSQYVLVMGHFPVYSVAEHGPTQCLLDLLNPLLIKYKVSGYFSGHDHNLQHIKDPSTGMNYFVSGAVDVVDPSMKHADSIPKGSLMYHWGDILGLGGFATVDADRNGMVVEFHSAVGSPNTLLYKYLIPARK